MNPLIIQGGTPGKAIICDWHGTPVQVNGAHSSLAPSEFIPMDYLVKNHQSCWLTPPKKKHDTPLNPVWNSIKSPFLSFYIHVFIVIQGLPIAFTHGKKKGTHGASPRTLFTSPALASRTTVSRTLASWKPNRKVQYIVRYTCINI